MGEDMKTAGGVMDFMGKMTTAKGLEEAATASLESQRRTAADLRARGRAALARGTHEYEDLTDIKEAVMSDFDAAAGGGGGDPSTVKRKAQIEGRYAKVAADALTARKQEKQDLERKAESAERDAISMFNYYNSQAAGTRFSAFASLITSGADMMTLGQKYGSSPATSVAPSPGLRTPLGSSGGLRGGVGPNPLPSWPSRMQA
jgi:hypothetical protein